MSWFEVRFEPLDVLSMSDSRPLETGGAALAGAVSPPAFAGVIRTSILREAGFGFPETERGFVKESDRAKVAAGLIGHPFARTSSSPFQVAAPLLRAKSGVPFLPLPRFSVWDGRNPSVKEQLRPRPSPAIADAAFAGLAILSGKHDREPDPRWAEVMTVCHLLGVDADLIGDPVWKRASLINGNYAIAGDFRKTERQWGHRRELSGVPAEETLWSRWVERFQVAGPPVTTAGYIALVRGADAFLPNTFVARLAGDGHMVRVCKMPSSAAYDPIDRLREVLLSAIDELKGVLVYLATPAIFEDGWRPPVGAEDGLRIVSAAVGRPLAVSGWDLAKRGPKSMVRAVPAGSVYFFVVEDASKARRFVAKYHWNDALSRAGTGREGYGLSLCGVWDARAFFIGGQ